MCLGISAFNLFHYKKHHKIILIIDRSRLNEELARDIHDGHYKKGNIIRQNEEDEE